MTACTVVIPTRDRPRLLRDAVESALAQTADDTRVVVVDDGSRPAAAVPAHPRLEVFSHLRPRGVSAARNLGIAVARTPLVTFLDDDDTLRDDMVERSVRAWREATAPPPVGVLSGVAVTTDQGEVLDERIPPALREKGSHFSLEPIEPGRSYFCKQTLVVPRDVLVSIGGFDERFRSRVVTELFWRLNAVCSLVGLPDVTYELRSHTGPRLSTHHRLRRDSFSQLVGAHRDLLRAHPEGYARLIGEHVRTCWASGQPVAALGAAARLVREDPAAVRRGVLALTRLRATGRPPA